jgi:SPP1 gp7 family putative phage head morphogenesis protein
LESPLRAVLWGIEQTIYRTAVEQPEQHQVETWTMRIEAAIRKPVLAFNWEAWWLKHGDQWAADSGISKVEKADKPHPPDKATAEWDALVASIVDDMWPEAGETRAAALGIPFDAADMAAALADANEQVVGIEDALKAQLRGVMEKAYVDQTTQFGFSRQIREVWPDVAKQRADLIAVTEWNRAASAATWTGYTKQGVQLKTWFTVGDERVCSTCEDNAADGEIPIGQEFHSGDMYPPAHPGCRCNLSSA